MNREQIEQLMDLFTIAKLDGKDYVDEKILIELIGIDQYDILCDKMVFVRKFTMAVGRNLKNVTSFSAAFKQKYSDLSNSELIDLLDHLAK